MSGNIFEDIIFPPLPSRQAGLNFSLEYLYVFSLLLPLFPPCVPVFGFLSSFLTQHGLYFISFYQVGKLCTLFCGSGGIKVPSKTHKLPYSIRDQQCL